MFLEQVHASSPTGTAATSTRSPRTSCTAGRACCAARSATRWSVRRELDWVAKLPAAGGVPRARRARLGRRPAAADRPAVGRRAAGEGALPPAGWQRGSGRAAASRDERDRRARSTEPPEDTRAYFRGRCLARYGDHVAAASWDSVIFDIPGRGALQRVPTLDPLRGTREHVGALLDRCRDGRRPRGRARRRIR